MSARYALLLSLGWAFGAALLVFVAPHHVHSHDQLLACEVAAGMCVTVSVVYRVGSAVLKHLEARDA